MADKVDLSFVEISRRLQHLDLPQIECVVGIATGGIVPAAMVAHQLGVPFSLLHINFRDEANVPRHKQPVLLQNGPVFAAGRQILLVDDVSVSGATLSIAKAALVEYQVTTLVLKGKADYVLFPEVGACVNWPWKLENSSSINAG